MSTTSADKKFVFGDPGHCLAFGLGLGLAPRAPGTAGTLLAFPLFWTADALLPVWGQWLSAAMLFWGGAWLCGRTGRALGKHDDGGIVLDEIAAFYAVLLSAPAGAGWQLAAFVLFRFYDGVKPPPIDWLDTRVGGGLGVMLDDAAAALCAVCVLYFGETVMFAIAHGALDCPYGLFCADRYNAH